MKNEYGIKRILIYALFAIAYFILIFLIESQIEIDSDYANLVLEANDIISGNVFLSGWTLTGISFNTTDLLAFIVGAIFFGVSNRAYKLAISLMVWTVHLCGLWLCTRPPVKPRMTPVFFGMCMIPTVFAASVFRAHTVSVCYGLWAIGIADGILSGKYFKPGHKVLFTLLLALGICGDSVILLAAVCPLFIVSIFRALARNNTTNERKQYLILSGLTALGLAAGMLLDRLYFLIGSADKNEFMEKRMFETTGNITNKWHIFLEAVTSLMGADFWGVKLTNGNIIGYAIGAVLLFIAAIILIKCFIDFICVRKGDFISEVISVGIILLSLIFIFTDIAIATVSARYIAYFSIAFSILIIRNIEWLINTVRVQRTAVITVIILLSVGAFWSRLTAWDLTNRIVPGHTSLGDFLSANNLTQGYSGFANASVTTVTSNDRVKLRAIGLNEDGDAIEVYSWFCKLSWYDEPADFVVTRDDDIFGVTRDNIISFWGKSDEIIGYEGYYILIYDRDLSEVLER